MADLRRYVSLAILIGIPLTLTVYNIMNGDKSATSPTSTDHFVYWQLEHGIATFLRFSVIALGITLIVAALWKNLKAISVIGTIYLVFAGIVISEYVTNDPDFDYFVESDIGLFAFPIMLVTLRIMGNLRPVAKEQEKAQALLQLRNDAEKDLSKITQKEAQHWWFKRLTLILILIGSAIAVIGFYLPKVFPSFDPMNSFFAGFAIASGGLIWFRSKRRLRMYRDSG